MARKSAEKKENVKKTPAQGKQQKRCCNKDHCQYIPQ
jgi:hypothetical protein